MIVPPGAQRTTEVFAVAPPAEFKKGNLDVTFRVSDQHEFRTEMAYRLLGPLGQR